MKKFFKDLTVLTGLMLCCQAFPAESAFKNPIYEVQMEQARKAAPVNSGRVENLVKSSNLSAGKLPYFVVPAMSENMRLPYTFQEDGKFNGELRLVAAQDEFEPASFVLYSFSDMKDVVLSVSDLKGADGASIPSASVDMKVVKVWFQNGNGWYSYFADAGLKLTPELLLHDENMVKVDHVLIANHARLKDKKGERHVWVSAPFELDPESFNPVRDSFEDADTLQPISLKAGEFKQIFLTVHVPAKQAPGVYRGNVSVRKDGKVIADVPLRLRVLPFELPLPKTYFDLDRDFIISFMGGVNSLDEMEKLFAGEKELALKRFREYLVSYRNHGIFHPCIEPDEKTIAIMKELGFPLKPVIANGNTLIPGWWGLNFGGRMTFKQIMQSKIYADSAAEFYTKNLGHTRVLSRYGDEQGAAFAVATRPAYKPFHSYDFGLGCAGHEQLFNKNGYTYEIYPLGAQPNDTDRIRPINEIGNNYVGFYAGQHTGPENPQFIRRQHGMLGYLSNLSMVYNYQFSIGPWNDLIAGGGLYRPMVVAYFCRSGMIDTLQYEGLREGIDDMRYATKLKMLAAESVASGNVDRKLEGRKALQFLATLDGTEMDLNTVRAEMIEHILKLMKTAEAASAAKGSVK